ncbi:MAG: EAL domain-containing protein, partial [Huintestinicola sp.]
MGITIAAAMKSLMDSNNHTSIVAYDYRDGSFDISDSPVSDMLFAGKECPFVQLSGSEKVHPGDRFMLSAFFSDLMGINENVDLCDNRYKIGFRYFGDKSDDYTWMSVLAVITRGDDGRAESVVCYISPMTTDEIVTKSIVENFTNDKHPAVFAEGVKKLLSPENDKKVAFIQFDIENFKLINSRYGEQKGTEILNFITNGLDSVCREEQVHVRLTADVYMIVMSYDSTEEIDRLIETIQSRLGQYQDIGYKLVFGVNLVSDKTLHSRKLGDRAAMARQSIKGNALTNVGYYSDQEKSLNSRKFIEDRMYSALENGEFVMYLQPKYCISTSEIVGAEALVRWIHPEKGLISPAEFIPIFERNNFIVKLDEYMWEQACKTLRRWIDMGRKPLPVSVNISRAHLNSDKFIKTLDRLVEKYG